MTNIYLLVLELLICFTLLIILYKKSNINGMYYYIITVFILSSLMSLKTIDLYGFNLNLGIIPFTTIFIASNIIVQKKGADEIKTLILTILFLSIINYAILYLVNIMKYSQIDAFTSASYDNIFIDSPRLYFANIVTMIYLLFFNSKLYYYLKKDKNIILISNVFSSIIIQFVQAALFTILAYAITKEIVDIVKITMIRYIISLIVCLLGTIIIYITTKIKEK